VKTKERPAFALEDTLAVHGIRKNPFPVDEADDFFFSTPTLKKQIDGLRNLVEFGDLLLVVSGDEGAGKTTFLNQFILTLDKRWHCCRIDARAAMTLDSLVDELLRGFGLKAPQDGGRDDEAQAGEALLRAHLADLRTNGEIALVTVDDAQLLTRNCSDFLLGLAQPREDIELRLLLGTEPGRLGFSTSDAKRVHVVVLQPLDEQQSGEYIHTRLRYGGLDGDGPFSATVVADIHHDAGGLPGTIHCLALHTLLANTDTSRLQRRPSTIPRPMVYLGAALAIAGGAAVFLRPEPGFEPVASIDTGAAGKVRGQTAALTTRTDPRQRLATGDERHVSKMVEAEPQPEPFSGGITAKTPAMESKQAALSVVGVPTSGDAKGFTLTQSSASTRPANAVVSPGLAKGVTSTTGTGPGMLLAGNVTPATSGPADSQSAHDLDWLRKQEPSHYVIQLVGTRSAAAAGKFVDDHRLGSNGAWFLSSHENKPWFVVVYGMYPDKASARAAIKTLPEALRAGSPWPRSLTSVVESAR
jgi:DamX protein